MMSSRCSAVTSVRMSGGLSPWVGSPSVTRITLSGAGDNCEMTAKAFCRLVPPVGAVRLSAAIACSTCPASRADSQRPPVPSTTARGAVSKA